MASVRARSQYDPIVDHYEVLGVPEGASGPEIRRAYLTAARTHHPDFHAADDPATRAGHAARMQAITEAWHVLGDVDRRADYDDRRRRRRTGQTTPASHRTRAGRPDMPEGKGWTPRPGDDGWMDDFDAWADDRPRAPIDAPPDSDRRNPAALLPVGLFALAVASGFLGMVFESRGLLALSVGGLVLSSVLFVVLPLVEMTRSRRRAERAEPSASARRTPFPGPG